MSDSDTDRTALESQIAFLEDVVGNLDAALSTQQQQIFELQSQMRLLHQQLKEQGSRLDAVAPTDEPPPPHY